jgi:hypothetical protein
VKNCSIWTASFDFYETGSQHRWFGSRWSVEARRRWLSRRGAECGGHCLRGSSGPRTRGRSSTSHRWSRRESGRAGEQRSASTDPTAQRRPRQGGARGFRRTAPSRGPREAGPQRRRLGHSGRVHPVPVGHAPGRLGSLRSERRATVTLGWIWYP